MHLINNKEISFSPQIFLDISFIFFWNAFQSFTEIVEERILTFLGNDKSCRNYFPLIVKFYTSMVTLTFFSTWQIENLTFNPSSNAHADTKTYGPIMYSFIDILPNISIFVILIIFWDQDVLWPFFIEFNLSWIFLWEKINLEYKIRMYQKKHYLIFIFWKFKTKVSIFILF